MASFYSGTKLSREEVARLAMQAGFTGDQIWQMTAIAGRESSYDPGAHRTNRSRSLLSGDRGLLQINSVHDDGLRQAGIIRQKSDLLDPLTNLRAAKWVYDRQGLNAWAVGARKTNGSFWNASGDPFHNTDVEAAKRAAGNIGAASGSGITGGGSVHLPSDAQLLRRPNGGIWAVFDVGGTRVGYHVPNDGSVIFNPSAVRNQDLPAGTVNGGSANELVDVRQSYGTYRKFWDSIVMQVMGPNNPAMSDPGVKRVLAEFAGRPDMSTVELENRLEGTRWWKQHTERQLKWNDLSPAEKQSQIGEMRSRMQQTFFEMVGERSELSNEMAARLASGETTWNRWIQNFVKPQAEKRTESPWSRQVREEQETRRQRGTDVENTQASIRTQLGRWGVKWSAPTLQHWAKQIVQKQKSDDDLMEAIKNQAQQLYGKFKTDREMDTESAAAPWIETYNSVMEKQGSLFTPQIAQALRRGEDVWDFEQRLKKSQGWLDTKNARDEMFGAVQQLGSSTGFS